MAARAAAVQAAPAVRIDRWLWATRLYKSRSLAAEACDGGKVKVNGHTAKPHKLVRIGDAVSVTHPAGRKEFTVVALAERRGPASEARQLYEDHSPPPPAARGTQRFRAAPVPAPRRAPADQARAAPDREAAGAEVGV